MLRKELELPLEIWSGLRPEYMGVFQGREPAHARRDCEAPASHVRRVSAGLGTKSYAHARRSMTLFSARELHRATSTGPLGTTQFACYKK